MLEERREKKREEKKGGMVECENKKEESISKRKEKGWVGVLGRGGGCRTE